jgi:Lon protease-like protein
MMHGPAIYESLEDLPPALPVFPLSRAIMLPRARLPLNIFEPRYLDMVDGALAGDRLIGMIQPRTSEFEQDRPALYDVGCAGRVTQFGETGDGRYLITLTGICRFRVARELSVTTLYRQVEADWSAFEADLVPDESELPFERQCLIDSLRTYFSKFGQKMDWQSMAAAPAEALVGSLAAICPFSVEEKQALLEARTLKTRAEILTSLIEMAIVADTPGRQGPLQ